MLNKAIIELRGIIMIMNLIRAELYQLRTRRAPKLWLMVEWLLGAAIPLDLIDTIQPYIVTQLDPITAIIFMALIFTTGLAIWYFLILMGIGIKLFARREIK